jgi:heme/copper-type cytochrome/quinol oxidase subunit 3
MSITEQHSQEDHGEHQGHYDEGGDHHNSPQEKHRKEHIAVWLFIFGDVVFFLLEIFYWFYLRANNTAGMWRGAACTKGAIAVINGAGPTAKNECTDGLGNAITHIIPKASAVDTIVIVALMLISAGIIWFTEVQARQRASRKTTTPLAVLALIFVLAALGWQIYQFQVLPFTTVQGTYASTFEYLMGSNVAHFFLVLVVGLGVMNRSRMGKYEDGRWYQVHLARLFWVWIALSCTVLGLVTIFFA